MIQFLQLVVFIIFSTNECAKGQLTQDALSTAKSNDSISSLHTSADACRIGQLPRNGWVENINPPVRKLLTDDYINSLTSVSYKCKDSHSVDGALVNTCFKGKWISSVPECIPFCSPKDISSDSIVPTMCSYNGVKIQCSDPSPPGTIVNINCREVYKRDSDKRVQVSICGIDGVWTPPPKECNLTCGILTQTITNSPWSVDIVSTAQPGPVGVPGTIINARLVLSAANGFWNRTQQKTNDLSKYQVLIGLLRTIDQRIEIDRVVYAPNFNKIEKFSPSGNVAVVVLHISIEFKSGVVPVCLPFERSADAVIRSVLKDKAPVSTNCYLEQNSTIVPLTAIDLLCTNRLNFSNYDDIITGYSFDVPIESNGIEVFYLLGSWIELQVFEDEGIYIFYQNLLFYKDFIQNEIDKVNEEHGKTTTTRITSSNVDYKIENIRIIPSFVDQTDYCRGDNIPNRGSAYYGSNQKQIEFGEIIENSDSIIYRCIENHVLFGNSTNLCKDGKWIFPTPECKARCNPKEIQGWTLVANCRIQENNVLKQTSCNEPAVPGAVAYINCQRGYERLGPYQQTATCGSDGRWNPSPEKCSPICGEISQGGAYIIGGKRIEISKVPWHAGIYRKYRMNYGTEQICGGSIISAKVIISAVHCFWNPSKNRIHNKEEYDVAVGKSLRQFDAPEHFKIQFFKIENILYSDGYNDYAGYYANDIAVVVLDKFIEFKSYIAPVCIQFDLKYDDKIVQPGLRGKVAGWGLEQTSGQPSPLLKEIELPVVSRKECGEQSALEFRPFITSDKFCAGYLTGIGVCQGDSGGGLVIPRTKGIKTVYFLHGIVSSGANKQGSCDNSKYTTFTNVAYYLDLIEKYYFEYQPNL